MNTGIRFELGFRQPATLPPIAQAGDRGHIVNSEQADVTDPGR